MCTFSVPENARARTAQDFGINCKEAVRHSCMICSCTRDANLLVDHSKSFYYYVGDTDGGGISGHRSSAARCRCSSVKAEPLLENASRRGH